MASSTNNITATIPAESSLSLDSLTLNTNHHYIPRPYLGLLMPEPAADHDCDHERHKQNTRLYNRILLRCQSNKDWRSIPVFAHDDEFRKPLLPISNRGQMSHSRGKDDVQADRLGDGTRVVVIDGEEMVDMIG